MILVPIISSIARPRRRWRLVQVLLRDAEAIGVVELEAVLVPSVHEHREDRTAMTRGPLNVEGLSTVGLDVGVKGALARARVVRACARAAAWPNHPVVTARWLRQLAGCDEPQQRLGALATRRAPAAQGEDKQSTGQQEHARHRSGVLRARDEVVLITVV